MSICFDLSVRHRVAAANLHHYSIPTVPHYLDRILQYHDLIYLVDGQWLITENDSDYLLTPGDVLLLSAGHHHYTRLPCQANTRTICIHVTDEESGRNIEHGVVLPPMMHAKGHPAVRKLFEDIVAAFWDSRPLKEERLAAGFDQLILALADLHTDEHDAEADLANDILTLINATPYKNFQLDEVADHFGVSARTINLTMQKSVGMSFSKYQNSRKLEMVAKQLLIEPDIRLSEIAGMFGFFDEFHMSHAFKAKYGVSPSAYRKTTAQGIDAEPKRNNG